MTGKESGEKLGEAKTVEEILSYAVGRIRELCPGWTNYNPSDPGITLLELFSWLKEIQDFHMEQSGTAHKQEYLKLLGGKVNGKRPGRTWITVDSSEGIFIPEKTVFCADDIPFETPDGQMAAENIFEGFSCKNGSSESILKGQWLAAGRGIALHPFGIHPKLSDTFTVFLLRPLERGVPYRLYASLRTGGRLPVDEAAFDSHGFYRIARLELEFFTGEGWKPAEVLEDGTYGFIQDGAVRFRLNGDMAAGEPAIRFVLTRCGYITPPLIERLSLAMVPVVQKETVEVPPVFYGNGFPNQAYDLEEPDLYGESFCLSCEDPEEKGRLEPWLRVADFDGSKPWDRHYMLENGVLRFGDSIRGLAPEGRICPGRYEVTKGAAGNLKAGAIRRFRDGTPVAVTNEFDAVDGRGGESVEEALKRRLNELRTPFCAVTAGDYERLVKIIPGLLIDDCHAFFKSGSGHRITLAVRPCAPDGRGRLNDAYCRNIFRYLEERRMAGTVIELKSPDYFGFSVTCEAVAKGYYRDAKSMVEECIEAWASELTFGVEVSVSSLYGRIDALSCIRSVRALYLDFKNLTGRGGREVFALPPWGLAVLERMNCVLLTES